MPFFQAPPRLPSPLDNDPLLRSYLARTVPEDARRLMMPSLTEVSALVESSLYERFLQHRHEEPVLTQWDAWGRRIDHIELTSVWKEMESLAVRYGLVATAYEKVTGEHARVHQMALAYLLEPVSGVYFCPLAMTDGAAKTLLSSGNRALCDRALPRLLSRDPESFWTSGQWMTERTGGSDVAICETTARPEAGDQYRLFGTKWFSSATTSPMALTLARPEGNPPGGSGLALFYVEVRREDGSLNGIAVNRLKEKLGTRMVPTAELTLDGALATAVCGTRDGVKNITPMLAITRTWNAVGAVSGMRHGVSLARDYAARRVAFGAPLAEKPLHADTLAGLEAETQGAFLLTFRVVQLLGREENGTLGGDEAQALRLMIPLVKLTTGKQAVAVTSEVLEAFGGAGYVEDTGLPRLLRDAQVLPIWEGTTNVLSLDVLRAVQRGASVEALAREIHRACGDASGPAAAAARGGVAHALAWLTDTLERRGPAGVEAGARRLALTLGRCLEVALLVEHGRWLEAQGESGRGADAAARRLVRHGVDYLVDDDEDGDAAAILGG